MTPPCIQYKAGYKYQLVVPYLIQTQVIPDAPVDLPFIAMDAAGMLMVKAGYAWDGPSGPTLDTPEFMRGSLVHDALYQLMREGHIDRNTARPIADALLKQLCIEDGMLPFAADLVYEAVRHFAAFAASPQDEPSVISAPKGCSP